ncbi:lytic transglycosylase [Acinetobacter shaoyimingii]|uniref:LysM peptidoglycan-binding domain-containing protein n=1 Tax=Acinetobacter shaoyimingii TaxID=2715164 RepID=A0A6G8RX26_9GAMM|nr:LysM peptidoglycan-binding domain-containing protein [Acinetobacter shaoyimingii]QIO06425.1 LysM peptidoglycan-binding domain-containing protein [Acinetobacter shaoyimingii]
MYKPTTAVWQPSASFLFKLSVISTAVAGIGLTAGCSSTPSSPQKVQTSKQVGLLDANSLDSLEDLLSATDMRAVEGDRLLILKHGDVWKRMTVGFKMDTDRWDPRIEAQRSWFASRQPYIDRLSARASRYLYHTVKEAERRGIPTELALLPVIESSYDPAATSSAAAAGMWQFIPSTGRIYGLRQTSLYDGRRDVVESTRAAYEFLGSLYNQFGSWELALAAYNAGPGRVQQAINRNAAAGLPTDYWSLRLPQETMNYVPRFLAVAQIIKSPQKYGVSIPPIANRPHFKEVSVPAGASLSEIASIINLSRAELYQLNPGHRGDVIDAQSTMRLLIPVDTSASAEAKLKALKPSSGFFAQNSNATPVNPQPALTVNTSIKSNTTQATTTSKPVTPSTSANTNTTITANNTKATTTKTTPQTTTTKPSSNANLSGSTLAKTPVGSNALAAFATSAYVPSAPRIPVAVTPAQNVKPVMIEPPISNEEREKLLGANSELKASLTDVQVREVLEPQSTPAETKEVVDEIKALVPTGTEIVDPLDGKIKLTAIQTSQSVAAQQGEEVKLGFAYPKSVADHTAANSEEARRNKDKTFEKTESEVRVVAPKGERSTYTVAAGDTLATIAMKNGVNWRDIAKWNQIDPNASLFVGNTLYLYDAKPQVAQKAESKASNKQTVYFVKPNDSLTAIANQFNLSVQQLAERNNLSPNSNVYVGQKLSLVETTAKNLTTKEKQQERASTSKAKTQAYTVKRGEYLKQIAERYGLSNQELAQLTPNLKADSSLYIGQKINVPVDEVTAKSDSSSVKENKTQIDQVKVQSSYKVENYKVQRGDTLSSVAAQAKISLAELAELNKISSSKNLLVGETLKIPASSTVPESYTVKSGDNLTSVATKYNLTSSQLAELNGLRVSSGLMVGQKLKLVGEPETKTSSKAKTKNESKDIYVVSSGDTLASIARKYNLQLSYLAELNGLSRNANVYVGQKLKIDGDLPSKSQSSATTRPNAKNTESYTVKSGESLNVIANRIGVSTKDLAELNGLTARSGLQRGQTIVIPKTIRDYRIQSGDSLIRLANRYGLETHQLAEMNDMKPNAPLRIGDTIKVPNL